MLRLIDESSENRIRFIEESLRGVQFHNSTIVHDHYAVVVQDGVNAVCNGDDCHGGKLGSDGVL
jgi:hypothetical protein